MSVFAEGTAKIRHADTGAIYEIAPGELDWQETSTDDRGMGPEIGYAAVVNHPDLGQLTWDLWEYPLGAVNDTETDVGRHELLENFTLSLGSGSSPDPVDADEEDLDLESDEVRAKIDHLVEWFHERYEDPAERTPYVSAEGGYQWIWGGPYDAREVLGDAFPDENESVIEAAAKEIESDGLSEWAPRPGYEDEDEEERSFAPSESDDDFEEPIVAAQAEDVAVAVFAALQQVPDQDPGPRFEIATDDRIDLARWTDGDSPSAGLPLAEELGEAVEELIAQLAGSNGHPDLLTEAHRYYAAISMASPVITQIYARGVRLENAAQTAGDEIRRGDRPELPPRAQTALASVLQLHGAAMMASPEGQLLVTGAAAYRRPPEDLARARAAARQVSVVIQDAPDLFGPDARAAVADAAADIGVGSNPSRSTQVASGVFGNLMNFIGGVLKGVPRAVLLKLIANAFVESKPGGLLVRGGSSLYTRAFNFIVSQAHHLAILATVIGHNLHWLIVVAQALFLS